MNKYYIHIYIKHGLRNGTLRNAYNVSGSQAPRCVNGFPGLMSGVILSIVVKQFHCTNEI